MTARRKVAHRILLFLLLLLFLPFLIFLLLLILLRSRVVNPRAIAWAAIRVSSGPIGVPARGMAVGRKINVNAK
jgi:hypothetical protein